MLQFNRSTILKYSLLAVVSVEDAHGEGLKYLPTYHVSPRFNGEVGGFVTFSVFVGVALVSVSQLFADVCLVSEN